MISVIVPRRGPCASECEACRISIHSLRDRKTGIPWGFLAVARCGVHGLAFALYPPGHVPYGREPFVALGPDGSELDQEGVKETASMASGYFLAVGEAAAGRRWPVDSAPSPPDAVRSTQRRRLARAALLLGLEAESPLGPEGASEVGLLPLGDILASAARLSLAVDFPAKGREIGAVLTSLSRRAGRALMDRLAVLGHVAGLWGHPYRWRPSTSTLLELGQPFWRPSSPGTSGGSSVLSAVESINDFGAVRPP